LLGLHSYPPQAAQLPSTPPFHSLTAQHIPTESPPSTPSAQALLPAPHPRRHSLSPHHLRRDSQRRLCLLHRSTSAGRFLPTTAPPPSPATRTRELPKAPRSELYSW